MPGEWACWRHYVPQKAVKGRSLAYFLGVHPTVFFSSLLGVLVSGKTYFIVFICGMV